MSFEFAYPYYFLILCILPVVYFFNGKKRIPSIPYSSILLFKNITERRRWKFQKVLKFFPYLAGVCIIIGLARPRIGQGEMRVKGIDIMLALDISSSMLAVDLEKSKELKTRLDVVKDVVEEFIDKRQDDRIGMIAFAKNPYLVSPLTMNHEWLNENVKRLKIGLVPDGTGIGSAIAMSVNRFRSISSKSKVLILLTDGMNNAGKISPITAAEIAATMKVKIYTVLIGEDGIVQILQVNSDGQVLKDRYGNPYLGQVEMKMDVDMLKKIAMMTQGEFFRAKDVKQLKDIYEKIDELEKTEITYNRYYDYEELYIYPVGVAVLLLLLYYVLMNTRYRRLP